MDRIEPLRSPPAHDTGRERVRVCESEIAGYMRRYPLLDRQSVLRVIVEFGPMRSNVEAELTRLGAISSGG